MPTDAFFWNALFAGFGVALMAGPLGSFVVWRRMAYFGDAVSHAALLGVGLGLVFNVSHEVGIALSSLGMALLVMMQRKSQFSSDTLLGILAHSTFAAGVVMLSLNGLARVDVSAYLFGDILAVGRADQYSIYAAALLTVLLLARYWRGLLMMTVNEEIARVEGVPTERLRLLLMLMIAAMVAVSIKLVGMLLITSLLIIPAATAHYFSRSPAQMAWLAALIGGISVTFGMLLSYHYDTPAGPSIVVAASGCFVLAAVTRRRSAG